MPAVALFSKPNGAPIASTHSPTLSERDSPSLTAKVVGVDPKSDIAILKISAKDLPTVRLGESRSLRVGEWVLAIGAPFGFENSATAGIVKIGRASCRAG